MADLAGRKTRQSRQLRHASVPQCALLGADRWRSTAGRTVSWLRHAPQLRSDLVRRTSVSRSSHITRGDATAARGPRSYANAEEEALRIWRPGGSSFLAERAKALLRL